MALRSFMRENERMCGNEKRERERERSILNRITFVKLENERDVIV